MPPWAVLLHNKFVKAQRLPKLLDDSENLPWKSFWNDKKKTRKMSRRKPLLRDNKIDDKHTSNQKSMSTSLFLSISQVKIFHKQNSFRSYVSTQIWSRIKSVYSFDLAKGVWLSAELSEGKQTRLGRYPDVSRTRNFCLSYFSGRVQAERPENISFCSQIISAVSEAVIYFVIK